MTWEEEQLTLTHEEICLLRQGGLEVMPVGTGFFWNGPPQYVVDAGGPAIFEIDIFAPVEKTLRFGHLNEMSRLIDLAEIPGICVQEGTSHPVVITSLSQTDVVNSLDILLSGVYDPPLYFSGEYSFEGIANLPGVAGLEKYKRPRLEGDKIRFLAKKDTVRRYHPWQVALGAFDIPACRFSYEPLA